MPSLHIRGVPQLREINSHSGRYVLLRMADGVGSLEDDSDFAFPILELPGTVVHAENGQEPWIFVTISLAKIHSPRLVETRRFALVRIAIVEFLVMKVRKPFRHVYYVRV